MQIKMTVEEALEFADEWSKGATFHEGSQGWRVVCMLLAEEVRRLAEIELATRRDAKRYQFLRADFAPMGLNIDGNHAWAYRRNAMLKGPNLDAAIDAAIGEAAAARIDHP